MSLATSNRDGGRTNEAGHLRSVSKGLIGQVISGLTVSQRAAGANMSVDVAIGDAIVQRSDGTYGHPAWNDAVYNQVIAAADGSNPRRDIVVMYIDYGVTPSTGVANNTNGVVKIASVAGTAAGSPVDPSSATIQSAVGSGNPWIKLARVRLAAGATSVSNSVIEDLREMAYAIDGGGWISVPNSEIANWAYSSFSSTTRIGIITVPTDATNTYAVGNRLRIRQSTGGVKYGIITAVSATTLTVFFPVGTTLNNEVILNPYFSRAKAPFGFTLDAAAWTLTYSTKTDTSVAASAGVWYKQNAAHQLVVGIGSWRIRYRVSVYAQATAGTTALKLWASLAPVASITTSTLPTFDEMTVPFYTYDATSNVKRVAFPFVSETTILPAAQTTYNLFTRMDQAGMLDIRCNADPIFIIEATCAYL